MESFRAVHVRNDRPQDDEKSSKIFHSDGHSRRLPRTRTVPLIDPVAIVSRNYEDQVQGWPVFAKARPMIEQIVDVSIVVRSGMT